MPVLLLVLLGLYRLGAAVVEAVPLVSFGTPSELASQAHGRRVIWIGVAILLAASALLLVQRRPRGAFVVALPGLVCPALVYALPHTLASWLAFAVLAPTALVVALPWGRGGDARGRTGLTPGSGS
jgi:hypothetical protein